MFISLYIHNINITTYKIVNVHKYSTIDAVTAIKTKTKHFLQFPFKMEIHEPESILVVAVNEKKAYGKIDKNKRESAQ